MKYCEKKRLNIWKFHWSINPITATFTEGGFVGKIGEMQVKLQ